MNEIHNPYVPGAGVQPPELTGRDNFLQSADITIQRALRGHAPKSFVAVGLRGVGKTVLLNRVRSIATESGCHVAMVEAHEDKKLPELLAPYIRKILLELDKIGALNEKVKTALRVFRSFIGSFTVTYEGVEVSLGVDPQTGTADSGDLEIDLPEMFIALGEAAKSRGKVVVIILDEIQYLSEQEMSAVVMAMHKVSQDSLPVVLMGAGLPLLIGKMGESKSYAERLFSFPEIGALNYHDACKALVEPARREGADFEEDALAAIFNLTEGYPYFIQEWAYVCWNYSEGPIIKHTDIEHATPSVISRLDESFFRVRFDRLSPREKQFLRAMAELGPGPHRSGDIADILGVTHTKLGPCRANLISKGMIFSPAYGDTAFTVPLFDQYMRRVMPFARW